MDNETNGQGGIMNSDVKARWIEALRSGEYKQAQRRLKTDEGFCCLGVLCDLFAKEKGQRWEVAGDAYGFDYYSTSLPDSVQTWANLSGYGRLPSGGSLVDLNDNGSSFEEIAEIIEEEL